MAKKQEETEQKPVLHYVYGVWSILRPDTRQYKQQSVEITLEQPVAVEVPAEMVLKTITSKEGEVLDVLTPAGLIYVQQQFEKLYNALNPEPGEWTEKDEQKFLNWDVDHRPIEKTTNDEQRPIDADGWEGNGFDEPTPTGKAEVATEDDGWATDGAVFSESEDGFVGNAPDTETKEDWDLDKEWDK